MTERFLGECRVTGHRTVARNTDILSIQVDLPNPPRSGQFAMLHPEAAGCLLPRPFSVLSYRDDVMEILIKEVGVGSRALMEKRAGERVRVFAPLGRGFDVSALKAQPVVLVAGGVGLVPLYVLSRELAAAGAPAPVRLFGAQTPDDLPVELLEDALHPWQNWVERQPGPGHREGLVTQGLAKVLDANPQVVVATCGPTPMMKAVAQECRRRGVVVWVCLEEQMGCGAGVCRACVVPDAHEPRMRTVCSEGPVFRLDEIEYV